MTIIVWDILRKLILVPIIIVLTLIEWCTGFLTGMASIAINLIAGLCLIAAVASYFLGIFSGMECLRAVGIALGGIIIGNLLASCVGVITAIRNLLMDCIS